MSDQLNLFTDASAGPKGLRYRPEFVSRDQERDLIERLRHLPMTPFQFGAFEATYRVSQRSAVSVCVRLS
jgi:hypothetical protein